MYEKVVLAVGAVSLLPTAALISLDIILIAHNEDRPTIWSTSLASVVLEVALLVAFLTLAITDLTISNARSLKTPTWTRLAILFGSMTLLCLSAGVASVANTVLISNIAIKEKSIAVPNMSNGAVLISYATVLGLSFVFQLAFLAVYAVKYQRRLVGRTRTDSVDTETESQTSLKSTWRVKAIPYSSTRPSMIESLDKKSFDSNRRTSVREYSPPTPTLGSPKSSFSQPARSSSKRRLLSMRSIREHQDRNSLDYDMGRSSSDTYTDSLGLYSTDTHSRWYQGLEAPTPLETIPASPIVGESGFDALADLQPPPPAARQRSRSFSPVGARLPQRPESPMGSTDELHIHPLFRSDSPTPPPAATPGTVVTASPDAGKVIAPRLSNQSLRRVRSGTVTSQSSPLSRSSSSETFRVNPSKEACRSIREEADEERWIGGEEQLVPPIPDFVLQAGSRSSLTGYNTRRATDGSLDGF